MNETFRKWEWPAQNGYTLVLSGYTELGVKLVNPGHTVGYILPMNFIYKNDPVKNHLVRTELSIKQAQENAKSWAASYFRNKSK